MVITGTDALKLAIEVLGSQKAAADAVGVTQQAISDCIHRNAKVPAEWCIPLEKATRAKDPNRVVPRSWYRPDIYPDDDDAPRPKRRVARKSKGTRLAGAAA